MLESLLALPILLPVLFWAGYHYYKDRHLPEPPVNLLLCFVMGIGAGWISHFLYASLEPLGLWYDAFALAETDPRGLFWYAILAIGPIEEIAKFLPFVIVALRFKAFDDDMDGITYASFIALGYAAMENTIYLQLLSPAEAVARGFASPVVHIVFASIWGYAVGHAHLAGRSVWLPAAWSLAGSAFLHGVYDFFALAKPAMSLVWAGLVVGGLWVWRLVVIRRLNRKHRESNGGV